MNKNMKREYFGYTFVFENELTRDKFLGLYWDLFKDYEIDPYHHKNNLMVKVQCKAGVIPEIRKSLGDLITVNHYKYYIKAA